MNSFNVQLVTIIDPHLSSHDDYPIFKEAKQKGILVKEPTGKSEYIGHCWPGASSWVDFLHPESNEWWGDLYDFQKFTVSSDWESGTCEITELLGERRSRRRMCGSGTI